MQLVELVGIQFGSGLAMVFASLVLLVVFGCRVGADPPSETLPRSRWLIVRRRWDLIGFAVFGIAGITLMATS